MKPYHAAALLTTALVLAFLINACAKSLPVRAPTKLAWTLTSDVPNADLFCVIIEPSPVWQPDQIGLHCTSVRTVREFVSRLRFSN